MSELSQTRSSNNFVGLRASGNALPINMTRGVMGYSAAPCTDVIAA